jgi:hypothetical protein
MRFFKIFILAIIFPVLIGATVHKFYASTTRVEYVPQEQSLQIITEIFTDDIQQALTERNLKQVHLDSKKQTPTDVLLLRDYVFKKLVVFVNSTKREFNYIGLQYDVDRVKLYLEITNVSALEQIEIENKILFDTFQDQQNIIHVKTPETRRSLVLDNENPKGLLNFK